jgi:heme exporter protein CcmD
VSHAPFILASYVVALLGFGGLLVASLLARRAVKRELALRGLGADKERR